MHLARIKLAAATALAGALVVCGLIVAPAANAAITGSSITTPTDPTYLIADESASSQTFAISGTTTGGIPATDQVDIRCYHGTTSTLVASGVALSSDGSFSLPSADLNQVRDSICRLRAVPAGTTPSNLTPFAGPRLGVGELDKSLVSGGPNDGQLFSSYIWAQQLTGAFDWVTAGGDSGAFWGPVYDGYLFDPTFALTAITFYGNAGLLPGEKVSSPTRSELRIDGKNAYLPSGAEHINANATGLPALTSTYTLDAATGNIVIHESDPVVECPDATYPPTTTSCASFVSAGVTDNLTMYQDHDAHIAWVSEVFTSTDTKAHPLDLLWENNQRFQLSGDSTQVEYEFPGQSSFSMHAVDDAVSLPASSSGTILVRMHGAADGDTSTGQGAIVYDRPATGATFTNVGVSYSRFTLHQTGSVPAGGSTRFQFAYVQDYHAATVASLATTASTAFLNDIAVTRSGKGKGTVTSSPGGIACGKTCTHGYAYGTSVTLKAKASKGSKFSSWSGACKGTSACTVTTTDNVTVNAKFVLKPCVVPNVVGKSLKKAKLKIKKAFCSVGKITKAVSSKPKGTVISQKPKRGKRLKQHAKVKLVVSKG